MSITEYTNGQITLALWDYEGDPVYADTDDPGNTTSWGLNVNTKAIVDAVGPLTDILDKDIQGKWKFDIDANNNLILRKSTDDGVTWSDPVQTIAEYAD
jgi:hypothetical protein